MDRTIARAIKIQSVKVAVGLLLIGGLVGARVVSVRRVEEPPPAEAADPAASSGPLTEATPKAPSDAPEPKGFLEAIGMGDDPDESDTVDPDRPGRCDLPSQGIQFMRLADCQNQGGAFTPLSKKKEPPPGT